MSPPALDNAKMHTAKITQDQNFVTDLFFSTPTCHIYLITNQSIITFFDCCFNENQIQEFVEISHQNLWNFPQKIWKCYLVSGNKSLQILANIWLNKMYLYFIFWRIKLVSKNGNYLWLNLIENKFLWGEVAITHCVLVALLPCLAWNY